MKHVEPWPWIVAGGLAAMIATSLGFAWLAKSHPDPLVVADAYSAGLAWNGQQRARARAEAAGWQLALHAEAERDGVAVTARATDAAGDPLTGAALAVRRVRPSEGGYDADFPLDAGGRAHVPLPRPGRWRLVATAQQGDALLERVLEVQR